MQHQEEEMASNNRLKDDNTKEENSRLELIDDLLNRLGLDGKSDNKLTRADFLEITPSSLQNEEPKKEKDLVHAFIQQLLRTDYRSRHIYIKDELTISKSHHTSEDDVVGALFKKNTGSSKSQQSHIHPMDIQMAVFLCADDFLRQTMVTKLSQCQYAVPLLVPNPFSNKIECPLWTMRQITRSWKTTDTSGKVISQTLNKAQTPMVAFFKIGSVSLSKSQLINDLINERHDTFFHKDCPGSTRNCLLMDGVVEIAWYLPSGNSTDHFTDCVAFCNLHGDCSTNATQRTILTEMASVNVVLLPELIKNDNNMVIIKDLCKSSTPLIVLLTDEEEDTVCEIGNRKYRVALKRRSRSNITVVLRQVMKQCLSNWPVTFSLERVSKHTEIMLDEQNEDCQKAKTAAEDILRLLEEEENEDLVTVKNKYLPCQGQLWHDWCQKNTELRRLQSSNIEDEKIKKANEMKEIRKKQKEHSSSELIGIFVQTLQSLSVSGKMYFLKWTTILLDDFTSAKLSAIHQEYDQKWAEVLDLKKMHDSSLNAPKTHGKTAEQSKLEKISKKLNAANFGLEHILREMGQIYEAISVKKPKNDGDLSYLSGLAAELMICGHPMELMDGDAAHIPLVWVSAVLDELIKKLGDQRVFVLSVLGIQSSGKSTMLNAMFGLQFAVSAGRCTKGVFMQLVKVSEEMKKDVKFDYILVVDTEGLRALHLAGKDTIHHDNELATFVVGLGNMTLINIYGENLTEMQDILQIVVQAFMRMKQVRLNPSCMFVHQNVTDIAAKEKIMEGRRCLQDKLDEMTKLAAKEAFYEADCFSDIIAFDIQKDVRYFSQLWEGSPPMAPPNPCYSENVQELKRSILSSAKTNGLKLSQFKMRVKDLWNALLNENFVFSFKNVIEISVYRKLEEEYEKWTWTLRSAMLSTENKMLNRIASGSMETAEQQQLIKEMSVTLEDVQKAFNIYFEEDSEKEILIQWKSRFERQIQHLHDDLVNEARRKLDENIKQKNIRKKLDEQRKNYEKTLFEKSKELALKLKECNNTITDPKAEFDTVWGNWVSEFTKDAPSIKDANISNDVTDALNKFYEDGLINYRKNSSDYRKISTAGDYQEYIPMNRNSLGPIPLWKKSLKTKDQTSIRELISNVHQKAQEKVNSFPVSVQGYNATYVHEITRDVRQQLQDFKPNKDSFEFKKEFFVDVLLSVCEKAETRFAELHRKYKEANDPLIYFEQKKAEYFKVFDTYWKGATSAAVLGDQICSTLKGPILQSAYNMITKFICNQIRGKPPFNGNRDDLEKHILKSLAEQEGNKEEKFNDFLTYMYYPKYQYERFIIQKVTDYMAAENPLAVSALHQHLEHKQYSVVRVAEMAADKVKHVNGDAKMWLESFSNSLVDELGDTRVYLSDDDSKDITDFDVLVDVMKKELPTVIQELKGSLTKLSDLKMEMFREKPDEILVKHFCRCCWEKCPFCGAVCTKRQDNHAGAHSTDFHRSPGMTGMNYRGTTEFVIDFCTTAGASTKSFYPSGKATKSIPYQQYRTAGGEYAKWLITTDFSESVYWKWFVCKFKENLEMHFGNTFSGQGAIPAGWKTYKKSDAIASLQI